MFEVLNGRLVVPLPQEELRPGKLGGGGRCPRSTHAHDFIDSSPAVASPWRPSRSQILPARSKTSPRPCSAASWLAACRNMVTATPSRPREGQQGVTELGRRA